MYKITYSKNFLKKYKKIKNRDKYLASDIKEKIEEFKDKKNHKKLRVHKLQKPFEDLFAFSVNYKIRIIFEYFDDKIVVLLTVGSHEIYENK